MKSWKEMKRHISKRGFNVNTVTFNKDIVSGYILFECNKIEVNVENCV